MVVGDIDPEKSMFVYLLIYFNILVLLLHIFTQFFVCLLLDSCFSRGFAKVFWWFLKGVSGASQRSKQRRNMNFFKSNSSKAQYV